METPDTKLNPPAGGISTDASSGSLPTGTGLPGALGGVCNGTATVAGTACSTTAAVLAGNPAKSAAPVITGAWYIPQPWGHTDFSFVGLPQLQINDGRYVNKSYFGYG